MAGVTQWRHDGAVELPTHAPKPWRLPLKSVNHEPGPWVYRFIVLRLARMVVPLVASRHWAGQERIPRTGGVLVVANHISNFDPIVLGEYLIWAGRWPRYLGKSDIWRVPVLGWVARQCDQIPVYRNSERAKDSLIHARRALKQGKLVAMYPEGTITGDPEGWPMNPRTGAARIALETGVPVIPVGQLGADRILGGKRIELRRILSLRRRPVHVLAGDPVDLDRFRTGDEPDKVTLEAASVAIMDAVTALVEQLRGETAPLDRWELRVGGRVPQRRGEAPG